MGRTVSGPAHLALNYFQGGAVFGRAITQVERGVFQSCISISMG